MTATFSSALIFLIYFYLYHIYDDAIHFPADSDAFSFSNIGYTTLLGKENSFHTFIGIKRAGSSKSNFVSVRTRSD